MTEDTNITIDEERADKALTRRERIGIKVVLLLVGMIWPARYKHQIDAFLRSIQEELK